MARVVAFVAVALAVLGFPVLVSAKEYVVGDEDGWTTFVDYYSWAAGKTFLVGDVLVFNYTKEDRNVIVVNATGYDECISSPNSGAFNSGYDKISLTTPGDKYYICQWHCDYSDQRLKITVSSKKMMFVGVPVPSPSFLLHPPKFVGVPVPSHPPKPLRKPWWKF